MMTDTADFLVELGTEELPPKALRGLRDAFESGIRQALDDNRLAHGKVSGFASPRRLAVRVEAVASRQDDQKVELKGPPVTVAFDDGGEPKPAAVAFARKCGVTIDQLERRATDKGEWLYHQALEKGTAAAELLPGIVASAVNALPVPRPMRWGDGDAEFVRPLHWLVMLHGDAVIDCELFGIRSGQETRGHRFHAPDPIRLATPSDYARGLEQKGRVVADLDERLSRVRDAVTEEAVCLGGRAVADEALYDEVASLVEWPVAVVGSFERRFLELPREVVVATLTNHQRYFPVENGDGELMPSFITVSNIESREPDRVREGNERVITPRLADAAFFWETDRARPLGDRIPMLDKVVYQKGLGTIGDRSRRLAAISAKIAGLIGANPVHAERAGILAKCDLVTGMVGEFPELQGTMGRYYAIDAGEPGDVATALEEQYLPRFAGDAIPSTGVGSAVAIAEKLDALCGIFALGKKPSGNRDPFGLRRSALGIVRIAVEAELDIDLLSLIADTLAAQPASAEPETGDAVYDFIIDRLRAYASDHLGIDAETFAAVRDRRPASLADFAARLEAVRQFVGLDASESLAAANKRIGNILRQAEFDEGEPDDTLFSEEAEVALAGSVGRARSDMLPLIERRDYGAALSRLAELREPVDRFFDDVMVMVDDERLRQNRLALLLQLRRLFLEIADISRLAIR